MKGKVTSLNASVSTGIIMYEAVKQRSLVWKIITILTTLKTYLKMLTYTKYAPLFAQVFALSKFNSFQTSIVYDKKY
jgi:hypothetical protein